MQKTKRITWTLFLIVSGALRQAQIMFIRGAAGTARCTGQERAKVVYAGKSAKDASEIYTPDPQAPYAHPYYWAPFILMGHWL